VSDVIAVLSEVLSARAAGGKWRCVFVIVPKETSELKFHHKEHLLYEVNSFMMRADLTCFQDPLFRVSIVLDYNYNAHSLQYKCSPRFMYYDMAIWLGKWHLESAQPMQYGIYAL